MKYTEEDLRKLVGLIDDSYRGVTRDNTNGSKILETFLTHGFIEEKEEEISFTYDFLRRKLDWEEFCDATGIDYYATRNGFEIKDDEVFKLTITQAKKYELL